MSFAVREILEIAVDMVFLGGAFYAGIRHERRRWPYRWDCAQSDCATSILSNDPQLTEALGADHTQEH